MELKPARVKKTHVKEILSCIHPETQAYRITKHLLNNKPVTTGELAAVTGTGNLSDVITKQLNPRLAHWGLAIRCYLPKNRIRNQFLQRSCQHYYVVTRIEGDNQEALRA